MPQINDTIRAVEVVMLRADAPVLADVETPVREVVARMRDGRAGCALITREGKLAGIFTERDLLLKVLGKKGALDDLVLVHMTAKPAAVSDRDSIFKAVSYMQRGGFRHVPILDAAGTVVGCVRHKDIIAYLVEHFADRALNLPPDPDRVATERDGA